MQTREVLDSYEAAELLGIRPETIRNYARKGVIPGKKIGNHWRFIRDDLMAWLTGGESGENEAEESPRSARAFLQRARQDSEFRRQVESLSTDAERLAFVRKAGFDFSLAELEEAIKTELDETASEGQGNTKVVRKAQRYHIYLKISELNGQPVTDTMILDINAWGARIGSFSPFDTLGNIEITFTPPGETQKVHLCGQVVWSRLMSPGQYHAGVEFATPIDQLHREGKI